MPIDLNHLLAGLRPDRTTLFFGAGASLPSHAPSVRELKLAYETAYGISASDYTLPEQTGIIEGRDGRRAVVDLLREKIEKVTPTGAILNLPLYDWRSIFTTNYDRIVETAYRRRGRRLATYSSDFDFGQRVEALDTRYYKIHGTIEKDEIDGHHSRIVITEQDYYKTLDYREKLYNRLANDAGDGTLVIIGQSLADPDIKAIVDRVARLNSASAASAKIVLFMFERDDGRASLAEARDLSVCFGGLDDFFAALSARVGATTTIVSSGSSGGDVLDLVPSLRPATIDVSHQLSNLAADASRMFNGWAASYSDVSAGLTFDRDLIPGLTLSLSSAEKRSAIIIGPSGVGKTTAARQLLLSLRHQGFSAWEHKSDQQLLGHRWREVAALLRADEKKGCVFIDEAHSELSEINDLIDGLNADNDSSLALVLVAPANQWLPRIKSPSLNRTSIQVEMNKVSSAEVDRLLSLVENVAPLRALVEDVFAGFSRPERRRRLVQRCESEMFVCLKNIFASDQFDDIVLREYGELSSPLQDIYKAVAALQAIGVRVHRQLIIRLLGVDMSQTSSILAQLSGVIHETTVDEKQGIYAWHGRHRVITDIIAEYKYFSANSRYALLAAVIDLVQPTYDIELKTLREICSDAGGLQSVPDKKEQNILLRKMLSAAPRERVPRHRLIRNLIDLGSYDIAETEVRLFEKDFRLDGPATRYKVDLALARAIYSPRLMDEDRVVLLRKAAETASSAAQRFSLNKQVVSSYCEVGLQLFRLTRERSVFDDALKTLRNAEQKTADAEIGRRIARFESRMQSLEREELPLEPLELDE